MKNAERVAKEVDNFIDKSWEKGDTSYCRVVARNFSGGRYTKCTRRALAYIVIIALWSGEKAEVRDF